MSTVDVDTSGLVVNVEEDATPPPPKPRKRTQDRKPNPKPPKVPRADLTTKAIEDGLAQILTLPSIPCALAGDDWASDHFLVQGRATAKVVAEVSERNPTLRRWCERALSGETTAVLLMASFMYIVPPFMHWGIIPAPDMVKSQFGVPVDMEHDASQNGNGGAQADAEVIG